MRIRTIAIATLFAVATPVIAQQAMQAPGTHDASRLTGGTYAADPNHTLIGWRVSHLGFNDYFGIFGGSTGTLTLDPKNPGAAKVDITIPVSKVTTANAGLTQHLLKPAETGKPADFFGANPADARFVSRQVTVTGEKARILGALTLNGQTRDVTLDAEFVGAGPAPRSNTETVGFHAHGTIKRSEFGLGFGVPMVSDEVALDISAAFEKQ
ncbi:MAG: YceI family protein [Sphingomonas sp.]|uniref:YceI family protein n=1 Tax=Sphingomonas sp. TaxID=28214 RepID=UPI001B2206C7|nr:YceI family protein [Sphingomonas sp.]MBO9624646.1 YceI family protein [Sphingomonas sp.]